MLGCLDKRWHAGETLLVDSSFDGACGSRMGLVLPLDVDPILLFSSRASPPKTSCGLCMTPPLDGLEGAV